MIELPIYVLICLVISGLGEYGKVGFWQTLFLCVFYTPFVGLIAVIACAERKETC